MTVHNHKNLLKGMNQSAELVHLTQLFQAENIPFLAFKGIAFNHLAGIELSQRHTGDMDILLTESTTNCICWCMVRFPAGFASMRVDHWFQTISSKPAS